MRHARSPVPPALPRPEGRAAVPRPRSWRRFRHRPLLFWLLAAGLAALTAVTVARSVDGARAELDAYGPRRAALVAAVDLGTGDLVGPDDVEVRVLPANLLPAGALPADAVATGRTVTAAILAGEAFTTARLGPEGLSPVASLLPAGTRGLAVPTGPGALPLEVGDTVDVLATLDLGGEGPPTGAVALAALVVHVTDAAATVAVSIDEAPRVAYALSAGAVTLALSAGAMPAAG